MSLDPSHLAALHALAFTRPRPWSAEEFRALLAGADTVAEATPDGFALGRVTLDEAELLTLAVAPAARRAGLGRALLRRFLAQAAARGARTAFLEVDSLNGPARALYEAEGFALIGCRRGYYRDGGLTSDALVLRRALP